MKVVKASTVQLCPVLYSREGTVEKVVRKIHELGQQGVQFATFPESSLAQLFAKTPGADRNKQYSKANQRKQIWIERPNVRAL